jgi:hypothetical protein
MGPIERWEAALAAIGHMNLAGAAPVMQLEKHETRRYPEWRSRRKTREHRDASQRERSNRRKAAARAR